MFQGYPTSLSLPFPIKGINLTLNNDPSAGKYIQNILLGRNNRGQIRYGTSLNTEFTYDENRIFRNIIHGTTFLTLQGTSQNIVYVTYLIKLPFVDMQKDVTIQQAPDNLNTTLVTINLNSLSLDQIKFLQTRIYNGSYIFISQVNFPDGGDIWGVEFDVVTKLLIFYLPFPSTFFNTTPDGSNNFQFFFERGGIYKDLGNGLFDPVVLKDDLDPNVIVSSLTYQNLLLIANGIDPVWVYDGMSITPLVGKASIAIIGNFLINGNDITFNVLTNIVSEYQDNIIVGSILELISPTANQNITVDHITFQNIANNLTTIVITSNVIPIPDINNIIYKKAPPAFSYLAVGHNRLWALPPGRAYLNQFRPSNLSQKVYYAAKQGSVFDWFNQTTSNIDFIDLSVNNYLPENVEAIKFFQGKMLFIGRNTTQIWQGNDPTANFDGQNLQLGNFVLERVLPVGILQSSLSQELPNNLIVISTLGKSSSFYLNEYGQIDYTNSFIEPVRDYLEMQLNFTNTDRDYREMTSFFYPYNDLLGIKIKNQCLIYQVKNKGFWTTFSENFATATYVFYNEIDKNLYLGLPEGKLLIYEDKISNQIFTDYNIYTKLLDKLIFRVVYSWIVPGDTWYNDAIFLSVISLEDFIIKVKIYENNSETYPVEEQIIITQIGSQLDTDNFFEATYTFQSLNYSYESIKFEGDAFLLEFNGLVEKLFIFDKLILAGGTQNAN